MIHELTLGVSAMRAAQIGLDTVGQNLSNADTPGYHRQVTQLVDRYPTPIGKLHFGNGVEVEGIRHIRSNIVEQALFGNTSQMSANQTHLDVTRRIESLMTPGEGSLTDRLNSFFGRLEALSSKPGERVGREGLIQEAHNLTSGLHELVGDLNELQREIQLQVRETVLRINDLSVEIADLNERIDLARLSGAQPNDLIDRRDARVAELATLIDAELREQENSVMLAGGPTIFNTSNIPQLVVRVEGFQLMIDQEGDEPVSPSGGRLAALLSITNEAIPALQEHLNEVVRGLVATVDRQHVQGVGIDGAFTMLRNQRQLGDVTAPLATLDTILPVTDGELVVAITNSATGQRTLHSIAIDASTNSITDVAAALDSLDHFSAALHPDTGTLTFRAQPGYTFDFTGVVPAQPDLSSLTGSAVPTLHGDYSGQQNDEYTFRFVGSGTVGSTAGLQVEVLDQDGSVLEQLDVGLGYEVGSELELPNGLSVSFSTGTVVDGEAFSIPTIADSDSAAFLTAFGFNTFFVGSTASSLRVNDQLMANSDLLATSRNGDVSDASNVNRMALRRDSMTTDGDRLSVEQYTQRFVAEVGRQVQEYDEMTSHLTLVQENLQRHRNSISGVDPNEELVHMLQFQRSFQTAARYITVISDVTAELMNIIR